MTTNFIHRKTILSILILALLAAFACSSGSDSEKVTQALANRLTSAIQFTGGELKTGEPPAENADDTAYPQIKELETEPTLNVGSYFTVTISGEADAPESIVGAIVTVDLADSYIQVSQQYDSENNEMVLSGTLSFDDEIPGKTYSLSFALLNEDGDVGNYKTWDVEVPDVNDKICKDLCDYNIDCGFFEESYEEDCLYSCKMDIAETQAYNSEECMDAIQATQKCAMKLECDQYISVFEDEEESEYCVSQNLEVDELCPEFSWPTSFERTGENTMFADDTSDDTERLNTEK